ncbi:MAG: 2Fe-2S iron-sulfur cluster binding domain-containing protein [Gammaproteobacteria bacterium]|nr:2Fe-2S iron-sulfur cluster binding domain-containing protein [Gammaproteobacteria bacterium]
MVSAKINGHAVTAPDSMNIIQAYWHAGFPRISGVGCLEGVCGSCRVMVRRVDSGKVTAELACQTMIEEGMQVQFLSFQTPKQHTYRLADFKNSWDVQSQFFDIFPEVSHCRHCGGCDVVCPKDIDVENGVGLAAMGRFREAGELFVECVMCNLCKSGCPEQIAPNQVGLFARRVTAYFHIRPSNLINRLEAIRRGEFRITR